MPDSSKPRHTHTVLIGLMGCGKSTIGRELSRRTGHALLDTDALIEEQTALTIPELFERSGEPHFRRLETALLRYLHEEEPGVPYVISTGGGIIARPENRLLLRSLGFVVWLHAPVPILVQRTAHAGNRPLLQGLDPGQKLARLLREREAFYRETAHWALDVSRPGIREAAELVSETAQAFFEGGAA